MRFAQLASIALDNARLFDARASAAPCHDHDRPACRTGELLTDSRAATRCASASADDAEPIALILLDLDRFKVVNESLGHAAGDRLLVAVGQRLLDARLRPSDTVARFGGDEFGIILDPVVEADEAMRIAERIERRAAARRSTLDGRDWFIGALARDRGRARRVERRRATCSARPRSRWSGEGATRSQRYVLFDPR